MRRWLSALPFLFLLSAPAQAGQLKGGPVSLDMLDGNHRMIDSIHSESVDKARDLGVENGASEAAMRARRPNLDWPVRLRPHANAFRGYGNSNYVDHGGGARERDFACAARAMNGHAGTDFVPFPFWWRIMDAEEIEVVAAAPGVIVNKRDGAFDRQCNTMNFSAPINFVVVRQNDGFYAYYLHLKRGEVTNRRVGSRVEKGDRLGMIGSSGPSILPHLHFELRTADNFGGATIDPFAGRCSSKATLWRHQPEVFDTDVLRLATHRKEPPISSSGNFCANPDPGYANVFRPGDRVWAAIYLRDMRRGSNLSLSLINPAGQVVFKRDAPQLPDFLGFSAWYTDEVLNEPGPWKLRAVLDGRAFEHGFFVGGGLGPKTSLQARIQPLSRSVRTTETAEFEVTVRNNTNRRARACALAPDAALAAVSNYRALSGGAPTGPQSPVFDVAPNSAARFQLTIRPKAGFEARNVKIPLRVFCDNAEGPKPTEGLNIFTLSFHDAPS